MFSVARGCASAGRIVHGQTEYVASFPGVHFREWGRVTLVMTGKSVACVFVPGGSLLYGNHDKDPDHPGKCFCQSFLCAPRVEDTLRGGLVVCLVSKQPAPTKGPLSRHGAPLASFSEN